MKHYTCTECRMESEKHGDCTDPECVKEGQELTSCECTDGQHGGEYEDDYYTS